MQSICSPGVATASPAVLASMRAQLDFGSVARPARTTYYEATRSTLVELEDSRLLAQVRQAPRSSGKDAFGWSFELFRPFADDGAAFLRLGVFARALLAGDFGPVFEDAGRTSPATPLHRKHGLRCVAVGLVAKRLFRGALLKQERAIPQEAVRPRQYVVGHPAPSRRDGCHCRAPESLGG